MSSSASPVADNNLQPFFLLHKGSPRRKSDDSRSNGKTRRKLNLPPPPSPSSKVSESEDTAAAAAAANNDHFSDYLPRETFTSVWSKIDSVIKDVLRDMNVDVFNDIVQWVRESFSKIHAFGAIDGAKAARSYPIVTEPLCKQLFTGLVITKSMEFVDDLFTFEDLGQHLKSHGCHVANLSSTNFSVKSGIGGCLRSFMKQFLMVSLEAADISVLASWYHEHENNKKPIVVIIDDTERCYVPILSDFILILSEWVIKIPIIVIMGVATAVNAPEAILPSNALQYLFSRKFILPSPTERMNAIIEAVLVKECCGFHVGHKVAKFLRDYFLRQDGTLTSFVRALKMAIVQHISMEPLSFILKGLQDKEDGEGLGSEKHALLPEMMFKRALNLPSCRNKLAAQSGEFWAHSWSELKRVQKLWSTVVLCLYEAGKSHNISLLDLYCEVLDPDLSDQKDSDHSLGLEKKSGMPSNICCLCGQFPCLHKGGFICNVIRKVRDLPGAQLCQLLKRWEKLTEGIHAIHEVVIEIQSLTKFGDGKCLKQELSDTSKRHTTRNNIHLKKEAKTLNEKAARLIFGMVRDYMHPIECTPFHEIVCFKDVDKLQSALIGDPRRTIQVDLLDFHQFLKCSCCRKSVKIPLPTMHDTSVMYMLAQEHGDLINVHDWYQSFKATLSQTSTKRKQRVKQSPSPKKKRGASESQTKSEVYIQAHFCRAITELQITGLLRMPGKRRPDYAHRVAFGL